MSHNFHSIPSEMRFYKQWVTWRYEEQEAGKKPTKVLYNPLFNGHASVDKPETWVLYDEAVAAFENNPGVWAGIGFVLTTDDPYCFIDLDNTEGLSNAAELFERQNRILNTFQSYAEWSPSGTGLHIIAKGSVERGRKRSQIEIYSQLRFMTMTGNIFRDAPIVDEDLLCKTIWHEMGGKAAIDTKANYGPQTEDDARVMHRMFSAENGMKTRNIYEGHWSQYYGSWSEADQALFNVLVFFTKNKEQIVRIFQSSKLATRKKAFRVDYLDRSIGLAFDRELPPVDTEGLFIALEAARLAANTNNPAPEGPNAGLNIASAMAEPGRQHQRGDDASMSQRPGPVNTSIAIPPGLVGEIAQFVLDAAPRPVPEVALVAALGLLAGIAGRAYNVAGSGLNQYLMMLAPTGCGKEAANSGISKLMHACVANGSPKAFDFIGPGQIRSDAALLKWLDKQPSFLSIAGEFGLRLKSMSSERAPAHEAGLKIVMLDLYTKSGNGQTLNPTAYSDKDKTVQAIRSPNFCMIGESTPERFYEALDEAMVYEGLLPRFTIFEYLGELPTLNKASGFAVPPLELVNKVAALMSMVNARNATASGTINVAMNSDAETLFDRFNIYCESFQRGSGVNEIARGVWSRAWLKAVKLAATVCIGYDMHNPMIDLVTAEWATGVVADECTKLIMRFGDNQVGEGTRTDDNAQHAAIKRVIKEWLTHPDASLAMKYQVRSDMWLGGVIPHSPLLRRLTADAAFKKAYNPSQAVKEAIKLMVANDELRQLTTDQAIERFNSTATCYMVTDPNTMFNSI